MLDKNEIECAGNRRWVNPLQVKFEYSDHMFRLLLQLNIQEEHVITASPLMTLNINLH